MDTLTSASTVWCATMLTGGSVLAVVKPGVALRVAAGVLGLCVMNWLLVCGLGIAVQVIQGPGMMAVERDTPFHPTHRALSHVLVVLCVTAFCFALPVAIERAIRIGGALRLGVHLLVAVTAETLVFLSAFSGYTGRTPLSEHSYFRFRALHTVGLPLLATMALLGWVFVMLRYKPFKRLGQEGQARREAVERT